MLVWIQDDEKCNKLKWLNTMGQLGREHKGLSANTLTHFPHLCFPSPSARLQTPLNWWQTFHSHTHTEAVDQILQACSVCPSNRLKGKQAEAEGCRQQAPGLMLIIWGIILHYQQNPKTPQKNINKKNQSTQKTNTHLFLKGLVIRSSGETLQTHQINKCSVSRNAALPSAAARAELCPTAGVFPLVTFPWASQMTFFPWTSVDVSCDCITWPKSKSCPGDLDFNSYSFGVFCFSVWVFHFVM